ncbi:AMP-binding protein [Lacisediminimonas profundi]|uniref:AMP-binding protein n=1 Tax=Lacisediminimonas profundi TaxID=2603856 RepID=UPI001F4FF8D6|nr:AMP-binding protein [Lacisediminimonas profundi]
MQQKPALEAMQKSVPADGRLWTLLETRAQAAPDALAFIDGEQGVTNTGFHRLCAQAAHWLRGQGMGRGDMVAVWLVNRVEWLALYFGAARVGATLVSVNTRYRSEEVTHILKQSNARMLVLQPSFRKIDFAAILDGMDGAALPALEKLAVLDRDPGTPAQLLGRPVVALELESELADAGTDDGDPDAPGILFTTSGTTKGPKLVMHPQRTITGHAWRCAWAVGLDQPGAAMLTMLPFCGVFGLNGALAAFAGGAPVVLLDTFDGATAADLLNRHKVTHTFGSDEMYRRMADLTPGKRPFPHARFFGFGAFTSAFDEYALAAWQRGIPLIGLYGSSEVLALWSAQAMHLPVEQRIQGGGVPVAGAEASIRIRDIETGALLPAGQSGEIELKGPTNFLGYYNNPEATSEALLDDGFFRTGDLGHLREDGSLVYETRMGDVIRLGGFLVNPVEIEEVLKRFPGVADAQVVAIDIGGQLRPVAFVIAAAGQSLAEAALVAAAREQMAAFKVPARVWFVDSYPVTQSSNGMKTQRNKLRDMARERLAQG